MRVFAAIPVPENIRNELQKLSTSISMVYGNLNFVKPDGIHLTLFFFGEIPEEKAEVLKSIMDDDILKISKIKTSLKSIGQFPEHGNPRVLFVDLENNLEPIMEFSRVYRDLAGKAGFREENEKPFKPHITIARNKFEKVDISKLKDISIFRDTFSFDRFVLYQSVLKPGGAEYRALKTLMFK